VFSWYTFLMENTTVEKKYKYHLELTTENPMFVSMRDMQTNRVIYQMQQDKENNSWRINTNSNSYKIEIKTSVITSKRALLYKNDQLVGKVIAAEFYPTKGMNRHHIEQPEKIHSLNFLFKRGKILLDNEAQLFRLGDGINEPNDSLVWYKGEYLGYGCIKFIRIDFKSLSLFSAFKSNFPITIKTYDKEISENFAVLALYSFIIIYTEHKYSRRPEIIFLKIILLMLWLLLLGKIFI
jgi:hypothetical protein